MMKSSRITLSLLAVFMLMAILLGPASAQAKADTFTSSVNIPISLFVFIPCANGGIGEYVVLEGNLHDLYHITFDSGGAYHFTYLDNPQGITGTGWDTGDKYQGTGGTHGQVTGRAVGYEETYVNNFRMIGQGSGVNYMVHETYHGTINANGTLTVYVDNFSVECKQGVSYP
jgi:hypothetical protein